MPPVSAIGRTLCCRPNPRDDYREVYLVTYEFDDGMLWTHRCQSLNNQLDWALNLEAYGEQATALISYRGKSYLKGGPSIMAAAPSRACTTRVPSATSRRSTRTSSRASTTIPPCPSRGRRADRRWAAKRLTPLLPDDGGTDQGEQDELDLSGLKA